MARKDLTIGPLRIESLRLEPGSHASPREGVCIVELASILANEKFSDEPDCVCEVIGAFLRSWNDRASYVDRQRLRPYAERIVGTRGSRAVTRKRRDICLVWSDAARLQGGPLSRALGRLRARVRIGWQLGLRPALRLNRGAGEYAAVISFARHGSEATFRLLDRMLEVGGDGGEPPSRRVAPIVEPRNGHANGNGHPTGNGHANGNGHTNGNGNGNGQASRDFVHAVIAARTAEEQTDDAPPRPRTTTRS